MATLCAAETTESGVTQSLTSSGLAMATLCTAETTEHHGVWCGMLGSIFEYFWYIGMVETTEHDMFGL